MYLSDVFGGLTSLFQFADVMWNKTFKMTIKEFWTEWLRTGKVEYTTPGDCCSASYFMIALWVKQTWSRVPEDLIKQSFFKCGLVGQADTDIVHGRLADQASGLTEIQDIKNPTGPADDDSSDEQI